MADGWTLSWLTSRLTVDSIACKDKENKRVFFSLVLCYSTIKKDEVLFSNKDMFNGNKSINPVSFTEKNRLYMCVTIQATLSRMWLGGQQSFSILL